jgi:flagellar motor switch protein FliM
MSDAAGLLRFAVEGERVRRASSALEQVSPLLASGLRRAMPFLTARGGTVALGFARAMPIGDLLGDLRRPIHASHLVLSPGGASGALVLDEGAIGTILDGVLGGDGSSPPELDPAGLSGPQVALLARVVEDLSRSFSEVTAKKFGFTLRMRPPDADAALAEGAPVVCSLDIGSGPRLGRVVLLLPKEALLAGADAQQHPVREPDPGVSAVLGHVELQVVAELARVAMSLGRLSRLAVGDVIRLEVPVGGAVNVRADGHLLLRGHPTTSEGQIAIRVARHTG